MVKIKSDINKSYGSHLDAKFWVSGDKSAKNATRKADLSLADWRSIGALELSNNKPGKFINNPVRTQRVVKRFENSSDRAIWRILCAHNDRFQHERSALVSHQRQPSVHQREMVNKLKTDAVGGPQTFPVFCRSDRDRRRIFSHLIAPGHDAVLSHRQQPLWRHVTTNWAHLLWKLKVIARAPECFLFEVSRLFRPSTWLWGKHACSSCVGGSTLLLDDKAINHPIGRIVGFSMRVGDVAIAISGSLYLLQLFIADIDSRVYPSHDNRSLRAPLKILIFERVHGNLFPPAVVNKIPT